MKKWMTYILIGACTAGMAVAEDNVPWWKKPFVKSSEEEPQIMPPPPPAPVPPPGMRPDEGSRPVLPREQKEKLKARLQQQGGAEHPAQFNPRQIEKMKAQHEALMKLGEAARNETDPVKKEALIAELRVKLVEIADKMQAEARKRLEQAGKEIANLQKRIDDYDKNKEARIEGQVQRILAGEPLREPEGKHKKDPKPPAAE